MIREISTELQTEAAYAIYSACMYKPAYPEYIAKISGFLSDSEVYCLGSFDNNTLTGILIVRSGEILGIAVQKQARRRGIGSSLINHAAQLFSTLSAETDDDAVDFYRACGFECTRFERRFPDGISVRYKCIQNNF